MQECNNCGTKFTNKVFEAKTNKQVEKLIKETYWLADGRLMMFTKRGEIKGVVCNCGQITLPNGRRVQLAALLRVLNGGKFKKEANK